MTSQPGASFNINVDFQRKRKKTGVVEMPSASDNQERQQKQQQPEPVMTAQDFAPSVSPNLFEDMIKRYEVE